MNDYEEPPQLHCGACMENFDDTESLNTHLDTCPAAEVLLPFIHFISMGMDKTGHPLGHTVVNIRRNTHLIEQYAYCIADGLPDFNRSALHAKLCDKLGLDYNKFRPFENEEITTMPNREEALQILWGALYEHLYSIGLREYKRSNV
jgi:hypothetical protein